MDAIRSLSNEHSIFSARKFEDVQKQKSSCAQDFHSECTRGRSDLIGLARRNLVKVSRPYRDLKALFWATRHLDVAARRARVAVLRTGLFSFAADAAVHLLRKNIKDVIMRSQSGLTQRSGLNALDGFFAREIEDRLEQLRGFLLARLADNEQHARAVLDPAL
jgi:hypothetical protein